jgi:hypothetical protein
MTAKSVLLKLSPEVHAAIQDAAKRHKRSMQSVLAALIDSWLAAGAPDPLNLSGKTDTVADKELVDLQARDKIRALQKQFDDWSFRYEQYLDSLPGLGVHEFAYNEEGEIVPDVDDEPPWS